MSDRALFLDRDGTIIVEKDFIKDPLDVELIDGAAQALKLAIDHGFRLFIITNQSGVARGIMTEDDVRKVNARVQTLFTPHGVRFSGAFYCPHHPSVSGLCACRKPGRGMIDLALQDHDIDLSRSYVIGDRWLDVGVGQNVGAGTVMIRTGYGAIEEKALPEDIHPDFIADDIVQAIDWIIEKESD